jgi:hypothetical protein
MHKQKVLIKGESNEKNNYVGNRFNDAAGIYWWMLAMVVWT